MSLLPELTERRKTTTYLNNSAISYIEDNINEENDAKTEEKDNQKKDIEINLAYENSIIALKDELSETCIHAKSLYLRCVHIPLYPRLTHAESSKIIKVLSSLP